MQQQQQHSDQDSDEDLSGINFPIIDNSTNNHQSTTKISCKDDFKKSNGYNTSHNQITNNINKGVDEDAIIRCFNMLFQSHARCYNTSSPPNIYSLKIAKQWEMQFKCVILIYTILHPVISLHFGLQFHSYLERVGLRKYRTLSK